MPLGDHAAHWANYLEELSRTFYCTTLLDAKCHQSGRRGSWQRLGPSLTCVPTWNPIAGHKSMRASNNICKRSTMKKVALKERYWVPDEDGTYNVKRIRRERPSHIFEVDWDTQITFWNDPKKLARAAQNKKIRQRASSYADRDPGLLQPSEICM
nr:hypothetical protein [Tanacetum cinerariifolium]